MIVDPASQTKESLGAHIPAQLVQQWRDTGRSQLIFFAELCPILVARKTWAKVLRNRRVLMFVDNEAAKAALIRNYSPLVDVAHMLSQIAALDVEFGCFPWRCSVPSKSNPSDAASSHYRPDGKHRRTAGELEKRRKAAEDRARATASGNCRSRGTAAS